MFKGAKRLHRFGLTALGFYMEYAWLKFSKPRDQLRRHVAGRLRARMNALGPTFAKLGQWLSLRHDLLSREMCSEFEGFFEEADPLPFEIVRQQLETELGKDLLDLFAEFEAVPLASAPLGQVHRAKLLDGTDVVVKVQRPGVDKIIQDDIDGLRLLTRLLRRHQKLSLLNLEGAVQELEMGLRHELDYRNEGKAAERFQQYHADEKRIVVPKVFWEFTTTRVLTLEYIRGFKALDAIRAIENGDRQYLRRLRRHGIHAEDICELATFNYIKQMVVDGFFHADPHPANVFLLPNNRICYIDFGLMGTMSKELQEVALAWLKAIVMHSPERAVEALGRLGTPILGPVRERMIGKVRETMERFRIQSTRTSSTYQLCYAIINIAIEHKIAVPSALLLSIKGMTTLEGVLRRLAPESQSIENTERSFRSVLLLRAGGRGASHDSYGGALLSVVMGHVVNYVNGVGKLLMQHELSITRKGVKNHANKKGKG